MSLSSQIIALAQSIGTTEKQTETDIKGMIGELGTLSTSAKANLVVALNELKAALDAKSQIDDAKTGLTTTWSSKKVSDQIAKAVSDLVNGAPSTLDSLKELADAMTNNKDAIEALQGIANSHVRFDSVQNLNETQKKRARDNIGAVDSAALATVQQIANDASTVAGEARTTANNTKNELTAFKAAVGDTTADFAKAYSTARGSATV